MAAIIFTREQQEQVREIVKEEIENYDKERFKKEQLFWKKRVEGLNLTTK